MLNGRWFETVGLKHSSYLAAAKSSYGCADGERKKKMLTDEEIKKLWQDPGYPGKQ